MSTSDTAPYVVAVMGSPRPRGNTAVLTEAALAPLRERGTRCETVVLEELAIAPCQGHEECETFRMCPRRDDAAAVLDKVYAADGLLLATPVYYENVTAQMKAFMDRNVFRYAHDEWLPARVVGLLVVTAETGLEDAFAALRRYVALSTQGEVPVCSAGGYADTPGSAAGDAELMAAARRLGEDMAAHLF